MIRIPEMPADYPMLASWWRGHGWPAVPQAIFPKLGALSHAGEEAHAAGWLYLDNSVGVAMLEWLVTNPATPPRETLRALREVIGFLRERATSLGYGVMLATCRQESLSKLLQKEGFAVTDAGVIHHLAVLPPVQPAAHGPA